MEVIAWVLAGLFAVLSIVLALRRPGAAGQESHPGPSAEDEAPGTEGIEDAGEQALRGMSRYLGAAVLAPLERGLQAGDFRGPVEDAVDALRDLAFYAQAAPEAATSRENLVAVIQEVTREYTRETGTPIKFTGPHGPVPVVLAQERFKDGLYLILANAGHFGGGQTVEVAVESKGEDVDVRVRDRGPGFTEEALLRAFEPFWTSESDALGLGLPQAKKLLEGQGARLSLGNRSEGGGEVVIFLRGDR